MCKILLDSGKIRNNLAKATLEKMLDSGKGALEFISESDMGGLDENALNDLCKQAVESNPKAVEDYKNGKEKAIKSLVGNVMKNSRGKADPALAESKIKELIGRKFRHCSLYFFNNIFRNMDSNKVGITEITVIVSVLFTSH